MPRVARTTTISADDPAVQGRLDLLKSQARILFKLLDRDQIDVDGAEETTREIRRQMREVYRTVNPPRPSQN